MAPTTSSQFESCLQALPCKPAWLINGVWCGLDAPRRFEVLNPSTGEVLIDLPEDDGTATSDAIMAARNAFAAWRDLPVLERAACLLNVAELLDRYREPLALLCTLEQGQPLSRGRGGIDYAIAFFRWFAEESRRVYGRTIRHPDPRRRMRVEYFPRGVAGIITPWNGPLGLPAKKVSAALAAGCTVVLKPAELTPLSACALAGLCLEAGIPAGVLNVVFGHAPAIGQVLLDDPIVRTLSFTGSLRTGRYLYAESAKTLKHLSLELGGNAPFIIFADADLDQAVEDLVWLKHLNSGQVCVTANRVLVERSVSAVVRAKLEQKYGCLKMGNGMDEATEQGPLITPQAAAHVDELVRDAQARGARTVCGGTRPDSGSAFYPPTILDDVPPEARLLHEETFGPVLPLVAFDSEAEAVALANATEFRLAAYAYTRDYSRAVRLEHALEFGIVGINDPRPVSCEAPFGGNGQAGLGAEGGREGLHEFLEHRLIGTRI